MKFKIGSLYEIVEFKDHSVGTKLPVTCKAVGYVIEDHKEYVLLSSWVVITTDIDLFNNNLEHTIVIKSCIKDRRLIK